MKSGKKFARNNKKDFARLLSNPDLLSAKIYFKISFFMGGLKVLLQ
jgi:hypothetical protein